MVCERHEETINKIEGHEIRIRDLELSDATMGEKIKSLTDSLEKLIITLEKFMTNTRNLMISALTFACSVGIGFIIWFIQNQ